MLKDNMGNEMQSSHLNEAPFKILTDVVLVYLTYNQERFIPTTLASAMNQTCLPSSLIVMDDASQDRSDQIIKNLIATKPKQLNIEYERNKNNIGLVGQINKLVNRFENKLIVIQAGDDESYPERLEKTYQAWIRNNKPSLVLANYDRIDTEGNIIAKFDPKSKPQKPYSLKRIINRKSMVFGCCAAFDSNLLNFFGPINSNVINEDRVNAFRAYHLNGIYYLHEPLLRYRSEIGISSFKKDSRKDLIKKLITEADRELKDIDCHFKDIQKAEAANVKSLLISRQKNILWKKNLHADISILDALRALTSGVSIGFILSTYKKISKYKS